MPRNNIKGSLKIIVDKMNEVYPDKVDDTFNIGVDKRVIPVIGNGNEIIGWKIQKKEGDIFVDICDKIFNTMQELIENNKTENYNEKIQNDTDCL